MSPSAKLMSTTKVCCESLLTDSNWLGWAFTRHGRQAAWMDHSLRHWRTKCIRTMMEHGNYCCSFSHREKKQVPVRIDSLLNSAARLLHDTMRWYDKVLKVPRWQLSPLPYKPPQHHPYFQYTILQFFILHISSRSEVRAVYTSISLYIQVFAIVNTAVYRRHHLVSSLRSHCPTIA